MTEYTIHVGDVSEVIPTLRAPFDGVLSDPPYGLAFMAKDWDHSVPGPAVWRIVLDALRPGASIMAFGGTRTFHRLTCAVEDAGAEIRDMLVWMYGSGFPKNHDISKAIDKAGGVEPIGEEEPTLGMANNPQWNTLNRRLIMPETQTPDAQRFDGYGTAFKPAYEPIVWAMKNRDGSFSNNATTHGVAGIHIDAGRIGTDGGTRGSNYDKTGLFGMGGNANIEALDEGRWPANVILDEAAGAMLDGQAGDCGGGSGGNRFATGIGGVSGAYHGGGSGAFVQTYDDSGGASRFFYCPKASKAEREAGLDGFRKVHGSKVTGRKPGSAGAENSAYAGTTERKRANIHPTVKPVDLCRYLAAMLLPPPRKDGKPRRILVPFSGSGSEMIGALLAGWDEVIGVELSEEYAEISRARLAHWERYRCADSEAAELEAAGQESLLDLIG